MTNVNKLQFITEDFTTPIESLKEDLEFIQTLYDVDRIKDRDNAELLIDSYKRAIELLTNAKEVKWWIGL